MDKTPIVIRITGGTKMKILPASRILFALALSWPALSPAADTECSIPKAQTTHIRLGIVLSTDDAETVFNVFRLANFAADSGDTVSVFLLGRGVTLDCIKGGKLNIAAQVRRFLDNGQKIMACTTCLKFHKSKGSEICPLSTMQDLYDLVRDSDRVITF